MILISYLIILTILISYLLSNIFLSCLMLCDFTSAVRGPASLPAAAASQDREMPPRPKPNAGSSIPDWLRLWEFSTLSVGSWALAGAVGYFLCARLPPHQHTSAGAHRLANARDQLSYPWQG